MILDTLTKLILFATCIWLLIYSYNLEKKYVACETQRIETNRKIVQIIDGLEGKRPSLEIQLLFQKELEI